MTSAPRLLLIDNYDSFTYNLVQAFLVLGADVFVHRNDAITVAEAQALAPTHLCISPGPGTPRDAGVSIEMIKAFAGRLPVLGVCLGHQSIVEALGGDVVRAGRLMHGKVSKVEHDGRGIFAGLPQPFDAGRYHSLIAKPGDAAGGARSLGAHGRGRDHGRAPQGTHGGRRAVPPGEHPHARRADADGQLPGVARRAARGLRRDGHGRPARHPRATAAAA